jgi:DNA primase
MTIFDFIKSRLSIQNIVTEYVQLKRAGGYLKGSCPFHSETDASFTISPDKNIFYCFGCHSGGDVISFIAKIENLSQIEAVQFLVDKYNIEIPSEIKQNLSTNFKTEHNKKEKFFQTCDAAAKWMCNKLISNKNALSYVQKRNIDLQIIKNFEVGYLPGGIRQINTFIKEMAQQNILLKDLMDAGILMESSSSVYSPYEERIIFPIINTTGRHCGFGGRIFNENDQRAKYYNSKESTFFEKGKLLFNLNKSKKNIQTQEYAFLVEGYTDCIAMHHHGYKNTVATLGTACTIDHLKTLARYTTKLYVLYDGDSAGQKAILRLTQLCWKTNLDLFIVKLPKQDDPASFLEKNKDLNRLIENASDIFTFFIESTSKNFWQKTLSEKMIASEKIISVIAHIDNKLKQDLLLQKVATITQIPFDSLKKLLQKNDSSHNSHFTNQQQKALPKDDIQEIHKDIPMLETKIFAALLNKPTLQFDQDLIPFFTKTIQNLVSLIYNVTQKNNVENFNIHVFLEKLNPKERIWVTEKSILFGESIAQETFDRLISHFQKQNWKQIVQNIKVGILQARQQNDTETLEKLLGTFSKFKQGIKNKGLI